MPDTRTLIFRASLKPKLYREFEIPAARKLYDLAGAIVRVYGFEFDHPFGFYSSLKGNIMRSPVKYELFADLEDIGAESDAGSVRRTRIGEAFSAVGRKMSFLFDYGDNWQFLIEAIGESRKEQGIGYPRLLKSVGKAPKQYPDPDDE